MALHKDIFNQVEVLLKKHHLHEPDPEKSGSEQLSPFVAGFLEIIEFQNTHGRFPDKKNSIAERKLAARLKGIAEDSEKRNYLMEHDNVGLLKTYCKEQGIKIENTQQNESVNTETSSEAPKKVIPEALKGISESSAFASLMGGMEKEKSLFGGRFAKKAKKEQEMPDYISKRKDCVDFDKFRPFFEKCIDELKSGVRKAVPFKNEQHIEAGKLYVLGGLLCYVADKGKPYMHKGKRNTRLRLIFINERESDMLMRSLATELYKGGLMITENESELFTDTKITPEDQETGWIYVLKSLSKLPQITEIPNLHKIGFTTSSVEQRIAGAEKFATFLCAPVKVVATAKTANLSSHTLEKIIHAVFGKVRLDIEVTDAEGQIKKATEWFTAPWSAIEHALQLIANGQIEFYDYNPDTKELEFRK